jgi:hypothetical protein
MRDGTFIAVSVEDAMMSDWREKMPDRIKRLPQDERGFPVPWFVAWIDDVPDFRVVDTPKIGIAVKQHRCFICGERLGQHLAFVVGPMCTISRTVPEPPSHRGCAEFSAKVCPFLSKPRMRRNEKDLPENKKAPAGIMIPRNPGVVCLWVTRHFRPYKAQHGVHGVLFEIGLPEEVEWYAEGRKATRDEIMHSIDTGLPILRGMAEQDGPDGLAAFDKLRLEALKLVPAT